MKMRMIIVATITIGFFAWLSQILTPVHPKDPRIGVFGRTMLPCPPRCTTWDGKIAVIKRSDVPTSLHW